MGHTPPSGAPGPDALGLPERATPGMFVAVSYRLSEPDGVELDAARDVPLTTVLGSGRLVPGLEQALIGCVAGDQLDLVLPPEACFGAYDPGGRRALPRAALPDGPPLHAGTQLTAVGDDGWAKP